MMQRWLPLAVFLALAALLLAGVRLSQTRDPNVIPSPLIGKPAPTFALPELLAADRTVSDQDLRGAPYLLNVFASWCPACRIEHPVVTEIARRGIVRVIGYNYKDEREAALAWLKQFGNPYERVLVDADGRKAIDWGIYGAPETFLVDAQGTIRYKHVGPMTWETVEKEILPRLEAAR